MLSLLAAVSATLLAVPPAGIPLEKWVAWGHGACRVELKLGGSGAYRVTLTDPGIRASLERRGIRFLPAVSANASQLRRAQADVDLAMALEKAGYKCEPDYYRHRLDEIALRADENGSVPDDYRETLARAKAREGVHSYAPGSISWSYLGPNNMDVPAQIYNGIRSISGRVNAIAADPVNPNVLYVGSAAGGVHKTVNGGATWAHLGDDWTNPSVSSLAVHPTDPNIIFAGTGDFDGFVVGGGDLRKSIDGGATWTVVQDFGAPVTKILIDPEQPNVVLVSVAKIFSAAGIDSGSSAGGLYRSTDTGDQFVPAKDSNAADLTSIDVTSMCVGLPLPSGYRVYMAAGASGGTSAFWRSTNRGLTWAKLPNPGTGVLNRLAASKVDPLKAYLLNARDEKVFKTASAGIGWTVIGSAANIDAGADNYQWSQKYYDTFLETSAGEGSDHIILGLISFLVSTDGGSSWTDIGRTATDTARTHNDQHACLTSPVDPSTIYIGNDGGLYRMTRSANDVGFTFSVSSLNKTLGISTFVAFTPHPTDPNRMIGGTQDDSNPAALGDLANWLCKNSGDGGGADFRPGFTDEYAWVGYPSDDKNGNDVVTISEHTGGADNGYTLTIKKNSSPFVPALRYAPDGTGIYFVSDRLYKLESGTGTPTNLGQIPTGVWAKSIEVFPGQSKVVYIGFQNGWFQGVKANGSFSNPFKPGQGPITGVSPSRTNYKDVIVCLGGTINEGKVYHCADYTAATPVVEDISGDLPNIALFGICRDPYDPMVLYVATDIGVFVSYNFGANWVNFTQAKNLPSVPIRVLRATDQFLYAATYGRGVWRLPFSNARLQSLTAPSNVANGKDYTATVTTNAVAPPGGFRAALSCSSTYATVPDFVTIPEGSNSADFQFHAKLTSVQRTITLTARFGDSIASAPVNINPAVLESLSGPTTLIGGDYADMHIQLDSQTALYRSVSISTYSPYAVPPATVSVYSNGYSADFICPTLTVSSNQTATLIATLDFVNRSHTMTLTPGGLLQLEPMDPNTFGLAATPFRVTLSGPRPRDTTVILQNYVKLTGDSTVVVPAGQTSAVFSATAATTSAPVNGTLKARLDAVTLPATVRIQPTLQLIDADPNPVGGGGEFSGRVRLLGNVDASVTVPVTTASSYVAIPSFVQFTAGQREAFFIGTASNVTASRTAVLRATTGGNVVSTALDIHPGVTSMTLSPNPVVGGRAVSAQVVMRGTAAVSRTVALSYVGAGASGPASVVVPAGQKTAAFSISTQSTASTRTVTVVASFGGSSASAVLTITP